MTPRGGEGLLQYSVTCQFAFFNRAVNSRQVLINNSARSEIKMADLRVAHLALRQTDVSPTGAQLRAWIIRVQLVVKGSGCQQRGVSVLVALFAAADQAAAGTGIATGERVTNHTLAIKADGKPIKNIVELAREHGRAIGLVTDTKLTDPTSAAFYAHPIEPSDVDKIAAEFVDRGNIDMAMGGGAAQFLPITKAGGRQDNRDLLLELRGNGFDIVRTRTELETIPAWRRPKLFGVFDD